MLVLKMIPSPAWHSTQKQNNWTTLSLYTECVNAVKLKNIFQIYLTAADRRPGRLTMWILDKSMASFSTCNVEILLM